ncbi:hypothetical protein BOX15_Mlig024848g1, partial [Macrostomum lignano]
LSKTCGFCHCQLVGIGRLLGRSFATAQSQTQALKDGSEILVYNVPVRSRLRRFQQLYAGLAASGIIIASSSSGLLAYYQLYKGKRNELLSWMCTISLTIVLPASAYFAHRSLIAPKRVVRSVLLSPDGATVTVIPLSMLFKKPVIAPVSSLAISDIGHRHVKFTIKKPGGPIKFSLLTETVFIQHRPLFRKLFRAS